MDAKLRDEEARRLRAAGKSNVDGVANVSLISGRFFVLVGAGERAESLPRAVSGETFPIEQLDAYCPKIGMILANCSAIGMELDVQHVYFLNWILITSTQRIILMCRREVFVADTSESMKENTIEVTKNAVKRKQTLIRTCQPCLMC
ncbi:unnamed protein product [Lactuca saligna]|uniref:Uncharacterized protein n=1 Tax=Lactuca saligna TaxID=75948 RepID=A0AA35ZS78_LACSI|nr:unnamed protein product [Lactuca saligna]